MFVGGCRPLLRASGTRGHECLSTVRYDAWITPFPFDGTVPRHGVPPLQPFPLPPSRAAPLRSGERRGTCRHPRL